jgi:effector-binding domain-containing protein
MIDELEIARTDTESAAVIHLTIPRDEMRKAFQEAIHEILNALKAQGLAPDGGPFARHFRFDPGIFDFELGFPVSGRVQPRGRVKAGELPSVKVVRTLYAGPYDGLPRAWQVFTKKVKEGGHAVGPEFRERYLKGPEAGPDPSAWRTELSWRLEG